MTTTASTAAAIAPGDVASLEAEGIPQFPTDRAALRRHLLDAIVRIRPILEADAEANDADETLAWPSVVALYREGLLSLKVPRELGGARGRPAPLSRALRRTFVHQPVSRLVRLHQQHQRRVARRLPS